MLAIDRRIPTVRQVLAVALEWGTAVLLLSIGATWLVYEKLLHDPGGIRVISPGIAATVTTVLTYRLQNQDRLRRLAQLRRFEIISEMNHHIRNALQVISYQAFISDAEAHGRIRDALNRIEWALRDVLPHVVEPKEQPTSSSDPTPKQ
jgi:hypothetical protein